MFGSTKKQQGGLVPISGVEVEIFNPGSFQKNAFDEEGEICCSGPNVMVGYYNLPHETEEVIFEAYNKRWFRTGDLGRVGSNGVLRITGRVKEQYKLTNGKFVVPGPIEDLLKLSRYVSNAFVFGENLPYSIFFATFF